jgi:hypothetical protein
MKVDDDSGLRLPLPNVAGQLDSTPHIDNQIRVEVG